MIINLKTKKIKVNGEDHILRIRLIVGWHMPNLSLSTSNMTINHTFFNAIFNLLTEYSELLSKYENIKP